MKEYWKSSTIWIGTAFAAIGAFLPLIVEMLNYVGGYDFAQSDPNWFLFVSGLVMVIQRWRTKQPITLLGRNRHAQNPKKE
jgi:hypothetical protein